MPGNETNLNIKLKILDDGSITIDRFSGKLAEIPKHVDSMNKSISLIKWDSLTNLARTAINATERIYAFGRSIASAANDIQRQAEIVGTSTNQWQKWTYAAKMADVPVESLMTSMKFLSQNIVESRIKGSEADRIFKALGITGTTLGDVMYQLSDRFRGASGEELKITYATKLMGRGAMEMVPYLNLGSDAIKGLGDKAEKTGTIIGDVALQAGSAAENEFKELEARINSIKVSLAPLALLFADTLGALLSFTDKGATAIDKLSSKIYDLGQNFEIWLRKKLGVPIPQEEIEFAISHGPGYKSKYGEKPLPGLPGKETGKEKEIDIPTWYEYSKKIYDIEQKRLETLGDTITVMEQGWLNTYELVETKFGPTLQRQWGTIKETTYLVKDLLKVEEDRKKNLELINKAYMEYEYKHLNEPKEIPIEMHPEYGLTIIEPFKKEIDQMEAIWKEFGTGLSFVWSDNISRMLKGTESFGEGVKNIFADMGSYAIDIIAKMAANYVLFGNLGGKYTSGLGLIGIAGKAIGFQEGGYMPGSFIPIKAMASGGYFDQPTLGLIAEKGEGEYVIPKSKMNQMSGSGGGNITYIHIVANDAKSFMDMVHRNEGGFTKMITKNIRRPGGMRDAIRGA